MKAMSLMVVIMGVLTATVYAQITPSYTADVPPPRPSVGMDVNLDGPNGTTGVEEGVSVVLWDQTDFGLTAWIDQVFTDFPNSSSFQVADISTGSDVWQVNKVTTYFTQGIAGSWSPATVTSGNLQVYSKSAALPSNGADLAPEYTVPITLVDEGGFTWRVEADTTGIPELQCITGDFWVGLTPITNFAVDGQEYHWTVSAINDETALRNPGGAFGLGAGWVGLSGLDGASTGPPYEGAIKLEGSVLAETWVDFGPGTGLLSPFWGDIPLAAGSGFACAGETVTVTAFHAGPPFGTTILIMGFSTLFIPFKFGTLVPNTDVVIYGVPTSSNGDITLMTPWPVGVPPGVKLSIQFWQNESPWSATNGIEVTAQ